jgi:flavodoxin
MAKKILVTWYSRDGHTRKVGKEIAKQLNADYDEIIDLKSRKGIVGWLGGGKDALFKKPTSIKVKKNPKTYDLVIIGTPNWVGTMTPAVRQYLAQHKNFKKVAFFATFGGNQGNIFKDMKKMSNKIPLATLGLKDKSVKIFNKDVKEQIKRFCKKINQYIL